MKNLKLVINSDQYKDFYRYYLCEYHQVKLKNLLYLLEIKDSRIEQLKTEKFHYELSDNYEQIIHADIRANYFHCIETFFELFFALIPKQNGTIPDNLKINEGLLKSNMSKNYERIKAIAEGKFKLDFLKSKIKIGVYEVSILHYLFYFGTFKMATENVEMKEIITNSEPGLIQAIRELAKVFSNRFEYNSYKHGLRLIRSIESISILNRESLKAISEIDFSKSFTYQVYDKKKNSIETISKNFDLDQITNMTYLCSNMVVNIIALRKIGLLKDEMRDDRVPIAFFDKDEIEKCFKISIPLAEIRVTSAAPK